MLTWQETVIRLFISAVLGGLIGLDRGRRDLDGPSASHLAAGDPTNTEWQRDLSVSHEKIGDVQSAQGDLKAALSSYQKGLEIAEKALR